MSKWIDRATESVMNYEAISAMADDAVAQRDQLREALNDVDLRITQARLASGIGRRKDRTAFLLGELERMQAIARAALKVN